MVKMKFAERPHDLPGLLQLNEISVIQNSNGLPTHSTGVSKYAGLFSSVYGSAGFSLDKQPMSPGNGPLGETKSAFPAGSMLFQSPSAAHSSASAASNVNSQNSPSLPAWSSESLQHHHFERDAPPRPESDPTPPSAHLAPPPTPRGEGLAA